jgi:DNA-binding protein Fis
MKATQTARHHLLNALKLLSGSTFVKYSHANQHHTANFQVGELSKQLRLMRENANTEFVMETQHTVWQHNFIFTLNSPQHLIVVISRESYLTQQPLGEIFTEPKPLEDNAHVQLEFMSAIDFPQWLSQLAKEHVIKVAHHEQDLFFHQCIGLLSSFEIASQYDALSNTTIVTADEVATDQNKMSIDEWMTLWQEALNHLVNHVCRTPEYYQAELGTWLEHTLFQQAAEYCKTNNQIASLLQLPISTARRKAQRAQAFNHQDYPKGWPEVAKCLAQLASGEVRLSNPLNTLKSSLLGVILEQEHVNMTQAAHLLGVSEPTLYKLKRELQGTHENIS